MAWPQRPMASTGSAPRPVPPISNSAAPPYRAKKKKPGEVDEKGHSAIAGEVNPKPNNMGRMTGPPMQMVPGQGSMFADGRSGQPQGIMPRGSHTSVMGPGPRRVAGQPEGMIPPATRDYPHIGPGPSRVSGQMQGTHPRGTPTATYMMADGGMGAPPDIGGGDPDMDQDQDQGAAPAASAGPLPVIKPESVNYHDDAQNCSGCQHMDDSGQCAVLQMQVSPDGGCNAFDAKAMDTNGGGDTGAGFGPGNAPADDSGNPMMG